jgi:3-phosphoshikimate 1-carboxyvinyltransferase
VRILAEPARKGLCGRIALPGDKSISHRAVMFSALAEGRSEIRGFLAAEDTLRTAAAFRALGVPIRRLGEDRLEVEGVGLTGLCAPFAPLDCGNSGTAMRLLAGLLSAQPFASVLVGDASLSRRPMRRVVEPLRRMGARIAAADGEHPPLQIAPAKRPLLGIRHELAVASAQVKSCLLFAGLYAEGKTLIREPHPTRDHTERMLAAAGWPVREEGGGIALTGPCPGLHRLRIEVPGDFSSAAFPLVAALLVPGSRVELVGVGVNPRRIGLLRVLEAMGARVRLENERLLGGEPVADLVVESAALEGIAIPPPWVPDLIDEFPVLFVAAALAQGETVVRGAGELRVKESDRIAVMVRGLRALGIEAEELPDGAVIRGGRLRGGTVDSAGDHRCAMAFAIAGLVAGGAVTVLDCENVATSFPGFLGLMRDLGADLRAE